MKVHVAVVHQRLEDGPAALDVDALLGRRREIIPRRRVVPPRRSREESLGGGGPGRRAGGGVVQLVGQFHPLGLGPGREAAAARAALLAPRGGPQSGSME